MEMKLSSRPASTSSTWAIRNGSSQMTDRCKAKHFCNATSMLCTGSKSRDIDYKERCIRLMGRIFLSTQRTSSGMETLIYTVRDEPAITHLRVDSSVFSFGFQPLVIALLYDQQSFSLTRRRYCLELSEWLSDTVWTTTQASNVLWSNYKLASDTSVI